MYWTHFILLVLAAAALAKEEETNEVTPPRPPINLDANLRRALLKALTELENEENEKIKQSSDGIKLPHLDTSDKIVEKASASALSFFASTGSSSTTTEKISTFITTTEEATDRPIVIIQRSKGVQHQPIQNHLDESEQFLTSASSSFTSSNKLNYDKSENEKSPSSNSANLVTSDIKATTKIGRAKTTTTTAPTTTTEESEAKVEDVQFFSAPLVAAFTVHQDERGLPKSVEPLFRAPVPTVETKTVKEEKTTFDTPTAKPLIDQEEEQLRTQLALQQKQKFLEDEILRLKQQQQQQNYLIRQQQLLHEQQLQLQKQKILDEQIRIRNNQQAFVPLVNSSPLSNQPTTTQLRNDFNSNNSRVRGSLVSFQPSISFNPPQQQQQLSTLPLNAQHLPVKNAVDFRSSPQNFQPFNFLSQQQPPLLSSTSNFNSPQTIQPQLTLTAPKHNRVFRQESDTGNFFNNGFSNNFNYFNEQTPLFQHNNNRFFRSNGDATISTSAYNFNRVQPPAVNQQLNNLLYNSGIIRGRQQTEDLNIISKVLSLNHLGGDYRYASSNVNEQRVLAPPVKNV